MTFEQRTVTYINREQRRTDRRIRGSRAPKRADAGDSPFGPPPNPREQRIALALTVTTLALIFGALTLAATLGP